MAYKQVLQKQMQDIKKKTFYRYRVSKIIFISSSFLFFVNFFFVGARFYPDFFNPVLPYTYFLCCMSFTTLIYFFCREKFLKEKSFLYSLILMILLIGVLALLILPVYFPGGIFYFF